VISQYVEGNMSDCLRRCELNIPYPPAKTGGKNLFYASLLTNDYAGTVSEMSAVSKYVFQHIVTANKKIADTLSCISIVEMRHLEYLGELIHNFGGNPRIAIQSGCNTAFWNAQYISYDTDPRSYLRENIANERAAIASYNTRINQINDIYVRKLLERIILDEENHIRLFHALLEEFF
jgi:bacterioferritin